MEHAEHLDVFSSEADAAVSVTNLTVSRGGVCALENVNACVPRGQCTAVVGPNGAGKTTFILALLRELRHSGTIRIGGQADHAAARIGYVPQQLHFDRGMPLTVTEFLALGLQRRPLWLGLAPGVRDRAAGLLEAVQAEALSGRRLGVLSGGETQRVLLALALAQDPNLLVLDEPAAGVDPRGESLFCELLESLRVRHGFTQLMVSHDLGMVSHHADHVICLNKTVIAEGSPREVLTAPILMRLFGLHMGLLDRKGMRDGDIFCSQPCCEKHEEHEHA